MMALGDARAFRTLAEADGGTALNEFAAAFALRSVGETDVMIEALSSEAIRQWRLADATFWQRVRFRARHLRATSPAKGA
ncbi:hypothetical protein [Sphingomonas sp. PB4P5]|uniref:hypothetical protein n=1 Tax=Parasphingomonas puruogangriensis TaxID=3096155 RepID=UPI002FC82DF2